MNDIRNVLVDSRGARWALVAGVWLVLGICFLVSGWPQTQSARHLRTRLFSISAIFALLGSLPIAGLCAFFEFERSPFKNTFDLQIFFIALISVIASFSLLRLRILPSTSLEASGEKLRFVTDGPLWERLSIAAKAINIPMPLLRLVSSVGRPFLIKASTDRLLEPELLISDQAQEHWGQEPIVTLAVLELSRLAQSSLWCRAVIAPISLAFTASAMLMLPGFVSILFLIAFWIGIRRTILRPVELHCDRQAARAMGFRNLARFFLNSIPFGTGNHLNPVQQINVSGDSDSLLQAITVLQSAVCTIPFPHYRAANLVTNAPLDDKPEITIALPILAHSWCSFGVPILWACIMVGTLFAKDDRVSRFLQSGGLLLVILGPIGLFLACHLRVKMNNSSPSGKTHEVQAEIPKPVRLQIPRSIETLPTQSALPQLRTGMKTTTTQHRIGRELDLPGFRWFVAIASIGTVFVALMFWVLIPLIVPSGDPTQIERVMVGFVVLLSLFFLGSAAYWIRRHLEINNFTYKIDRAFHGHEFQQARDLFNASPRLASATAMLRYKHGLADALSGDQHQAIKRLKQLCEERPQFELAALSLIEILLDAGKNEHAARLASALRSMIPNDVAVPFLEARALRGLQRHDDAQAACDRGIAQGKKSRDSNLLAMSAAIDLDRGKLESAEAKITESLLLAPDDVYPLLIRAEVSIQTKTTEQATHAIAQAIQAADQNPSAFLKAESQRVASLLRN